MSNFNEFDQQGSVLNRDSGSIISHAFEIYKGIFLYAIVAVILYLVGDSLLQMVFGVNYWGNISDFNDLKDKYSDINFWEQSNTSYYSGITSLLSILLSPLYVGLIYIANKYNLKSNIEFTDLFIGYRQNFLQIILYAFLTDIILIISVCFCVIPVFFVFPLLLLGYPILLFENASAIDAIKKSFAITKENYGVFLGAGLLGVLISISGLIACCIGIIVTAPFLTVVMYSSYCAYLGRPRQIN